MQYSDDQLGEQINKTMDSLNGLFLGPQKNGPAYLTLYEMFEINLLGNTLLPGHKKEDWNAARYDHGNRSAAALLLSGMNRYAGVDFKAIQSEIERIKKVKNPTEKDTLIKGLIKNVGNMEFVLSIVSVAEYTNAIYDKEMKKYPENTELGLKKRQQLRDKQDKFNEHLTKLMNNYLKQAHSGRQAMYPNISPAAQNSFVALATKLAKVNNGFDQLSKNTLEIYDFDFAMSLLAPLEKCTDLNQPNPYMVRDSYGKQIQQAQATYYNKAIKTSGRNSTEDNRLVSFMEEGMY